MGYVAPTTRATDYFVTAANWNQDVVDNVTFLANPPACRATHNTTQGSTNATEFTLTFNTNTFDTASLHSTSVNPERLTFATAGVYIVTWGITVAADTDYLWIYSYLRLNGTTLISLGSSVGTQTDNALSPHTAGSATYKFAANDYVEVRAAQKNTSAGGNAFSSNNYFTACWIGLG